MEILVKHYRRLEEVGDSEQKAQALAAVVYGLCLKSQQSLLDPGQYHLR